MSQEAAPRAGRGTEPMTKLSSVAGIVAAMVLATLVNVLVARRYVRWDVTSGGLYTLSAGTKETLATLEQPVRVTVLLPAGEPLTTSVSHMLEAYRAETGKLEVDFVDPDRSPAEYLAVRQRYGLGPGGAAGGAEPGDAALVVVKGDVPHFVTARELVEQDAGDESRARHRIEQALTSAIRSVTSGERPRVCFTTGHGERLLETGGAEGLAPLRDALVRNNYEPVALEAPRPGASIDLATCRVVVVAGPRGPFAEEEARALARFVSGGGSALLAVGPEPDETDGRFVGHGLEPVLDLAGARLRDDFVFERDPERRYPRGEGETFSPEPRPHEITTPLLDARGGRRVWVSVARSIEELEGKPGSADADVLLRTSEQAFGMKDFFRWAKSGAKPEPREGDAKGPLTVAVASRLPAAGGGRGGRIVLIGSASPLFGANWVSDDLRATAAFTQGALAWLAARPAMVDVPPKPAFETSLRLTEEGLSGVLRYVVVYIPLAVALLGVAVGLRRRKGDRRAEGGAAAGEAPAEDAEGPESEGSREERSP